MTKLTRYIVLEILKPVAVISIVLVGLFSSFNTARYLAQAVTESLGMLLILKLILLKTIIAMEVLFPIAFYAAVIVALGRMHRDQEIIVLQSAGVSETFILKTVIALALPIGILVGVLSVFGRPWAYGAIYFLDDSASSELDLDRYQARRFYGSEASGRIIYIDNKTGSGGNLEGVFHYIRQNDQSDVILAKQGYQQRTGDFQPPQLHLLDGIMYRLGRTGTKDSVVRFSKFVFMPDSETAQDYQRKAAATYELAGSVDSRDIAEFQWRVSRPLATILLALVAIPLSRSSPRQGKSEKIIAAAVIFAVYYNLTGLAQTWVEQGAIGRYPGVWWLHISMLLVVIWVLFPRFQKGVAAKVHP